MIAVYLAVAGACAEDKANAGGGGPAPTPTVSISAFSNLGPTFFTGPVAPGNVNSVVMATQGGPAGLGEHTLQMDIAFSANGGTISKVLITAVDQHGTALIFSPVSVAAFTPGGVMGDIYAWMSNPDGSTFLAGLATDVVLSGSNDIDVVTSNAAATTANEFYFSLVTRSQGGGTGGAANLFTGDVVTFTVTVINTSGTSASASVNATMA